jgi:hypothetical protein
MIRLYNQIFPQKETPEGTFQGWYQVDAPLTENGEPNLDYWLTKKEIAIAKLSMYEDFNRPKVWDYTQTRLSDFISDREPKGVAYADAIVRHQPKYGPGKVKVNFTIKEIVTGISSVAPEEEDVPQGLWRERLMVIKGSEINYDTGELHDLIYIVTDEDIKRWREEN